MGTRLTLFPGTSYAKAPDSPASLDYPRPDRNDMVCGTDQGELEVF